MRTEKLKKFTFPVLAALALVLLVASGSGIVNAYFTTYVTADNWNTISLETEITVREELQDVVKTVSIENTGECDCWVRIRAIFPPNYHGEEFEIGDGWLLQPDGFYYYKTQLPVGYKTSSPFVVGIKDIPKINGEEPPEFNIVIVAECVPCAGVDQKFEDVNWDLEAEPEKEGA